jgi:hypothetical protein
VGGSSSSGAQYFQQQGLYTGSMWVLGQRDDLTLLLVKLADLRGLSSAIEAAAANVTESTGSAAGQKTLVFHGTDVTVTTAGGGQPRPVHVETRPGATLNDKLSAMKLDLHYGASVQAVSPNPYVDLADLDTLPTHVELMPPGSFSFDGCDDGGCSLSANVHNLGGRYGVASLTFRLSQQGSQVASCDAPVPTLSHGATAHVGCHAAFGFPGGTVNGMVLVTNPVV